MFHIPTNTHNQYLISPCTQGGPCLIHTKSYNAITVGAVGNISVAAIFYSNFTLFSWILAYMCKKCFLFSFFFTHSVADYYINLTGAFYCMWVSIILSNHLPARLKIEDETLQFCRVQSEGAWPGREGPRRRHIHHHGFSQGTGDK